MAKTKAPTEKQLAILRRMAAGERLVYHQGIRGDGAYYLHGIDHSSRLHASTARSLEWSDWVKGLPYKFGKFQTDYTLTDAGRAAIAAPDGD